MGCSLSLDRRCGIRFEEGVKSKPELWFLLLEGTPTWSSPNDFFDNGCPPRTGRRRTNNK